MKKFLFRNITEIVVGRRLSKSVSNLLAEAPNIKKDTVGDVFAQLFYRFTRIGLFTFLIAALPIYLLSRQNYLINNQNQLIQSQNSLLEKQNIRITEQNNLSEAQRRSSLMFLFANLTEIIHTELKQDERRALSDQTIGQVIALSKAFKPYKYLENNSLIDKELSPERGQLLVYLANAGISTSSLDKIYRKADFSFADLEGSKLDSAYLKGVNLGYGNLKNTSLVGAILNNSNLNFSSFINSDLQFVSFRGCDMREINLDFAYLAGTKLEGVFVSDTLWFNRIKVDLYNHLEVNAFNDLVETYGIERGKLAVTSLSKKHSYGHVIYNRSKAHEMMDLTEIWYYIPQ
jgi:uncharacterized protein YjbI with pentapeptide repeats